MAIDPTLWAMGPHPQGKHLVLRGYLDAWLPILSRYNQRILFVDGFAGPGEYEGGEEGSPVIALRSLIEHHARDSITSEIVYLFIERDERRAAHLQELVNGLSERLPPNATVSVTRGSFDEAMTEALDALDAQRAQMTPALVMIDPFGIKGVPLEVIRRILHTPKCEVYISFMYENMSRFLSTDEFAPHLDSLFGTEAWREGLELHGDERRRFLYNLYAGQLRNTGANHVLHFDLYEEGRLVYGIFFATQHERGADVMKRSIWKVAPEGGFAFRGTRSPQLQLEVYEPDFTPLREQIVTEFADQGWVSVEDVKSFVSSDRCDYHTGHLKKLEVADLLEVDESTRKKKRTYPDGCRFRVLKPE